MVAQVLAPVTVVTPPALTPLTLSEVKAHLRVGFDDDDSQIQSMLTAAIQYAEKHLWRTLVYTTLKAQYECFPYGRVIRLPRPPLASVTSVVYYDTDGNSQTLSSSTYFVDTASKPGRIVLKDGQSWPDTEAFRPNAVEVTYVAGVDDDDISLNSIRRALLLLIGNWYENREAVSDIGMLEVPHAVQSIFAMESYREFV